MTQEQKDALRQEYEDTLVPIIPQGQEAINTAEWEWFISKMEENDASINKEVRETNAACVLLSKKIYELERKLKAANEVIDVAQACYNNDCTAFIPTMTEALEHYKSLK